LCVEVGCMRLQCGARAVGLWGMCFRLGFRLGGFSVTLREFKSCFATAYSRASDATSPSINVCLHA
jgi:hypothetical protein